MRIRSPAGERYQGEAVLGRGGMATVYEVVERASGRRMALKRLRVDGASGSIATVLFEREYLTLVQLSHPCIVEVYDYGVDEQGPYYTMELLDGGDLQGLAPLPWRRACEIARDVCSALSLLHSRRLVHRDLSPRNVRCTARGLAKVIDFGAMAPMGPSREFVGTLPFVAPEALNLQTLDGRTDLYALGATLYYVLTRRHAYPARDITQLRELFRARPRRPAELVPELPEALDRLIMSLLALEPSARPNSAAEVTARLSAIAGLRASEHLLVTQAYLSNPTLVGRAEALARAREVSAAALSGRGAAIVIRGASGAGRSRLLDAYVLEAKLSGLTVLRADASDAQRGAYGVLRALLVQLDKARGAGPSASAQSDSALLARAFPELTQGQPERTSELSSELRQQAHVQLQQALRASLLAASRERPLMLAVDDLPQSDDASAACLALLAQEVSDHGLVLVATVPDEALAARSGPGAVALLAATASEVVVAALSDSQTEELLRSVFGDVPNLHGLARYIQQVSRGNPRDVMSLAQHLVTEQQVQYSAGTWTLPKQLDRASLPRSMADALRIRCAALSPGARTLALAFALEPTQRFTSDECVALGSDADRTALLQGLDELVAAEISTYEGDRYGLRQASWIGAIEAVASPAQRRAAELALVAVYRSRGDGFRIAQHLLRGGALESGLDALLAHAAASEQRTDVDASAFYDLLGALPTDWLRTYEWGLALCAELARPARERDVLLSRLCGLVSFAATETDGYGHIEARIERLRRDAGLDDFAALPASLDFRTRLQQALGAAAARFQSTPEHDRVGDPGWSIRQIVKSSLAALGTITFTLDQAACARLPSLAPLVPLSPAVEVVVRLMEGLLARLVGRIEESIRVYHTLLARMAEPDRAGLTEVHHMTTHNRIIQGLGTLDAAMGRASCLAYVRQVESEPIFAVQGMFIRHIYLVWQGLNEEADRYEREIERALLESGARFGFEGQHLLSELAAYALCDDMLRVKRATDAVEPRARVHRAWLPVLSFGRGEYQRIRGDYDAAAREHEHGLGLIADGRHQIWIYTAGAHVRALTGLGRHDEAIERGRAYERTAEKNGVGYLQCHLHMPLSEALSAAGLHDEAVALADTQILTLQGLESTGLLLASAYETRARIAREHGDRAVFEHYAALYLEQLPSGKPLQRARLASSRDSQVDPVVHDELATLFQLSSSLESCVSAAQRAEAGLSVVLAQSGADGAALYAHRGGTLERTAVCGEIELDEQTDSDVRSFFARELDDGEGTEVFSSPPCDPLAETRGSLATSAFVRVVMSHPTDAGLVVTGVILLAPSMQRPFSYPARVAMELSRALADEGDADAVMTS